MIPKLLVFLFVTGVSTILAANVCKIGNIVHRSGNSQPYYFPNNWNENQTAPGLGRDQSCSWVFTVPHGYYAKLIISGKTGDNYSHFQTVDAAGNVVQTQHENKEPYYFPFPKFTLIVDNEAPATFGFKVIWAPFPNVQLQQGGVNIKPYRINITNSQQIIEFIAVTGVSVLAFPGDLKNYHALKSALLFDGNDMNAPFVNK
ncbi:hypothetical protein CAEBREN_17730 [Caenorhabditis brenneri]|uniref:CUB-like domain-containing protein n=1 Tax=Caenorhabditis brenneri TaxID=135651 RepID=G0N5B6_CAEBE|nr:hypothetical protein CAEBREN_17730 [Caenorhabditis brenneri]